MGKLPKDDALNKFEAGIAQGRFLVQWASGSRLADVDELEGRAATANLALTRASNELSDLIAVADGELLLPLPNPDGEEASDQLVLPGTSDGGAAEVNPSSAEDDEPEPWETRFRAWFEQQAEATPSGDMFLRCDGCGHLGEMVAGADGVLACPACGGEALSDSDPADGSPLADGSERTGVIYADDIGRTFGIGVSYDGIHSVCKQISDEHGNVADRVIPGTKKRNTDSEAQADLDAMAKKLGWSDVEDVDPDAIRERQREAFLAELGTDDRQIAIPGADGEELPGELGPADDPPGMWGIFRIRNDGTLFATPDGSYDDREAARQGAIATQGIVTYPVAVAPLLRAGKPPNELCNLFEPARPEPRGAEFEPVEGSEEPTDEPSPDAGPLPDAPEPAEGLSPIAYKDKSGNVYRVIEHTNEAGPTKYLAEKLRISGPLGPTSVGRAPRCWAKDTAAEAQAELNSVALQKGWLPVADKEPAAEPAAEPADEPPPRVAYYAPRSGKTISVHPDLYDRHFIAMYRDEDGAWCRYKAPGLRQHKDRSDAQVELDEYASSKGWKVSETPGKIHSDPARKWV